MFETFKFKPVGSGIKYDAVEFASVGYAYGDSTCGQRALYELGTRGIPIYNVRILM